MSVASVRTRGYLDGDDLRVSALSGISDGVTTSRIIDIEDQIKEILNKYNVKPTFKHRCNSCGGTLEMDVDNHIFVCPYCGSVYAVGISQTNG